MGPGQESQQPQIPAALQKTYAFGLRSLLESYYGNLTSKPGPMGGVGKHPTFAGGGMFDLGNQAFLGLDASGLGPDANELAAASGAMQTFGGKGWADLLGSVKNMAMTTADEGGLASSLKTDLGYQFEEGGAQIAARAGASGNAFSEGLARNLSTFRGELGAKYGEMMNTARLQNKGLQLSAAQLYGNLGNMGANVLMDTGAHMRGIAEANFNRAYQDIITRKFQTPLSFAQIAFGGASSAPLWQPTYGPGRGASMIAGATTGATVGTMINPGLGTAIGAGIGGFLGMFS